MNNKPENFEYGQKYTSEDFSHDELCALLGEPLAEKFREVEYQSRGTVLTVSKIDRSNRTITLKAE